LIYHEFDVGSDLTLSKCVTHANQRSLSILTQVTS